jgi:hypothetical protein
MTARILLSQMVVLLALLTRAGAGESAPAEPDTSEGSFLEMSLEELMTVEASSTATLTQTSTRLAPAAVTTISKEQILASGARSLFELLDSVELRSERRESDPLDLAGSIFVHYDLEVPTWSGNHVTKIVGRYKLDRQWTLDGSLRIYWGFPGLRSCNEYNPCSIAPPARGKLQIRSSLLRLAIRTIEHDSLERHEDEGTQRGNKHS